MRTIAIASAAVLAIQAGNGVTATADDARANALAPLVEVLGQVDDPQFHLDVLRGIHEAIEGRRELQMPGQWSAVAEKLAASPNSEVREKARELSVVFGDPRALADLRRIAADSRQAADARQNALGTLVRKRDHELLPLLRKLLSDRSMRAAAIRGLATLDDDQTPELILKHYASLAAAEKADAIGTLSSRVSYAMALVEAVESGRVPRGELSAFTVRQLVGLNHAPLTAKLEKAWGSIRPTSQDKSALIAKYKALLKPEDLEKGDRAAGRVVFARTCASCHKLFDAGQPIGPELTGSQRTNLDYVLENLVDPNAVVGRDYQMTVIVTDGGRIINGIITKETESAVTVQTANETVIVPKNEIEERQRSTVSMMPEGVLEKLTREEVRDLVVYLAGPGQVPLPEGAALGDGREEAKRGSGAGLRD